MYLYTLMNCPWTREEMDLVEICRRTKSLGIDGLDFIGTGYHKSWENIRKITDDHGLKTICFTMGVGQLESPDAKERIVGVEEFKNRLEVAHTLGSDRIMLNQGGVRSGNDSDTNRKWMIEGLKDAMPLANAAGIEVTIETHNSPTAPFKTSAHFSEAIAEVPDLKVCFDTGNSFINGEDPLQGYLNNKEHVTHMHFKDVKGELGKVKSGPCVPGTGVVDLPAIINAMKENRYNGYVNLEKGGPDGFEVYKQSMELLGPLIA
ncbi:hypothetical protein SCARR_01015 [Pontiella sulfatireligans]|uniref:Xylose isomerase-like TIM barrel domain-containing protein n=2 Tax=Pontiella sulfatireligans TaxID=2750658 RepID=A0A6C2UHS8_9BACT|nr:hypothetical protein SCARR_01015 [Pontiella sulfatireligans]